MTPAWRALWPRGPWDDSVLAAITAYLESADVQLELQQADDRAEYPEHHLAELDRRGLAALLTEAAGEPSRVTFLHLCGLNAITASCNASLAITVGVNALALLPVYIAAAPALRSEILAAVRAGARTALALTERSHGSDLLANVARADRLEKGGRYRLSGAKDLINGGTRHEIVLALLRTRSSSGPRPAIETTQDFTLFALDRGCGLEAGQPTKTLSAPAADICGINFDGVVAGSERIVGREGDGFAIIQKTLSFSRGGVSALASGAASRAAALALGHARERVLYGAPIVTFAAIADHLLRAWSCDLAAAAMSIKQAVACNALGLGAGHLTACAKLSCCDLAERAVRESAAVLGAHALVKDRPFHALLRDVWLYGVFDGTRHVMQEQIQWRLPQLALREEDSTLYDIATGVAISREPTQRLIDAVQRRGRVSFVSPVTHVRALACLPGAVDLAPLIGIAATLVESVAAAKRSGAWERNAGLRADTAEAAARLEAVIAMVELADPERRAMVVGEAGAWSSVHPPRYAYAVAWHAVELGFIVQRLAMSTGAAPSEISAALQRAVFALHKATPDAVASLQGGRDEEPI